MKTIEYDLDIYPLDIIYTAIKDYNNIASIEINTEGNKAIVTFVHCLYQEKLTIKEFGNYLIDLIGADNGN